MEERSIDFALFLYLPLEMLPHAEPNLGTI